MLSFWLRPSTNSNPPSSARRKVDIDDISLPIHHEPEDRVTYASKSNKVKFVCNLPANSQHLREVQNLSLSIFTGDEVGPKKIEGSGSRRQRSVLLANDGAETRTATNVEHRDSDRMVELPNKKATTVPSAALTSKQNSVSRYVSPQDRHSVVSSPRQSKPEMECSQAVTASASTGSSHTARSILGHKYTSTTHETYVLKNGQRRELFAAAPIGSQIAKFHDQIAAQGNMPEPKMLRGMDSNGWALVEERAPQRALSTR